MATDTPSARTICVLVFAGLSLSYGALRAASGLSSVKFSVVNDVSSDTVNRATSVRMMQEAHRHRALKPATNRGGSHTHRGGKARGKGRGKRRGGGRRNRRPLPDGATTSQKQQQNTSRVDRMMIDVCFLALGPPTQIDMSTTIIRNVEAQSIVSQVRYHLLVDKSPTRLRREMQSREKWRGVPKERVYLHTIAEIPASVRTLYDRLSHTATGPGPIYLYKPLLHLVLPKWLSRVIVLDTDIFLFEDLGGLWREFDTFAPTELLGVATEQCPSYQEVRALGGLGFNGGVQLLALDAMRRSSHYASLMEAYASGFGKRDSKPMKPGGIGWLGDQTLYSWMSVNGTGARQVFHVIPCGWNRQIGTHMADWKGFWERHRCSGPCSLLHGNYLGHKPFMESLKEDPTGRSCHQTVARYRGSRKFRLGSADAKMLDIIDQTCCRN